MRELCSTPVSFRLPGVFLDDLPPTNARAHKHSLTSARVSSPSCRLTFFSDQRKIVPKKICARWACLIHRSVYPLFTGVSSRARLPQSISAIVCTPHIIGGQKRDSSRQASRPYAITYRDTARTLHHTAAALPPREGSSLTARVRVSAVRSRSRTSFSCVLCHYTLRCLDRGENR